MRRMKFIVFSDSHGDVDHMIRAVRLENPNAVRGNCDLRSTLPRALTCAAGGVRIFATHGHLYGVKHDPIYRELCEAALAENADVVLFGHTHEPFRDRTMGMELLNPGSIGPTTRPSYGLILLDGDRVETAVRYLTR